MENYNDIITAFRALASAKNSNGYVQQAHTSQGSQQPLYPSPANKPIDYTHPACYSQPNQMASYAHTSPQFPVQNSDGRNILYQALTICTEISESTRALGQRYCDVESCMNSKQEWIDNQNFVQRIWYGINGETKRTEGEVNACTRELIGIVSSALNNEIIRNNLLTQALVQIVQENDYLHAQQNRQNQLFNEALRKLYK